MTRDQNKGNSCIRVALIHYKDDASLGGSLRVGQLIGNHLDMSRVEAHFVFAYGGPGPVTKSARIPVHFLQATGPEDLGGWLRVRRLMLYLQPDVIHFVNPVFWINLALWDFNLPNVLHQHGPIPAEISGWRNRLTYAVFRRSIACHLCVSRDVEKRVRKIGAGRDGSFYTIYNSIDCADFAGLPTRENSRRILNLPQDAQLLGMVGRLIPEKGFIEGLRLLAHLPHEYHLVVCGAGPMEHELTQAARAGGLESRVHLVGMMDSVKAVYSAIDFLLFLSKSETFGLVIAEAMAAGIPIVGIAGEGGYADSEYPLVTNDNARLLRLDAPPSRTDKLPDSLLRELAQSVVRLSRNPDERASMVMKAQQWVCERFDIRKNADELVSLYKSLLTHEGPSTVKSTVRRVAQF